jgi:hypothetical protein
LHFVGAGNLPARCYSAWAAHRRNILKKHFDLDMILPSSQNVFQLDQADLYRCRVMAYTASHSILRLELVGLSHLYLLFGSVSYFAMPQHWKGANFCTASHEEYSQLQRSALGAESMDNLPLLTAGRLFFVKSGDLTIKITSPGAFLTDDINAINS